MRIVHQTTPDAPTFFTPDSGSLNFVVVATSWCSSRRGAASRGGGRSRHSARSGVSISGAATRKNKSIWLLRPSGSFGSGRHQTARQLAVSNGGAAWQPRWGTLGPVFVRRTALRERHRPFRPSRLASSSRVPAVGRRRAALRVIRNSIALAGVSSRAGSFERPANSALEPSHPLSKVTCHRGARLSAKRYTDEDEEPQITFQYGLLDLPVFIAATRFFVGLPSVATAGRVLASRPQLRQLAKPDRS
jgi:hypothetical protein